ncbi:MAG TPA: class I SAM-dependent methyltransferase, partial [Thermomicrobiales bacterium]|nr:class I SAM-dependent methyltransferase [Thermomicrobiales bacterium]
MGGQDYNELAGAYRRHREPHPDVIDALIPHGEVTETSHVLEVGCGTGNYIHEIARRTGATCTGVDPSREMLRHAESRAELPMNRGAGHPEVTFVLGSAEDLLLADRQFDLVYSVDVIHHIDDRDAAARETRRVLKPGGIAMVVTESEEDLRLRTPHVTYFPDIVEVELRRYPSIETIQRELAAAGLEIGETIGVSRPVEVTETAPFRDKAYSSLHLIDEESFRDGLARMEADVSVGRFQVSVDTPSLRP